MVETYYGSKVEVKPQFRLPVRQELFRVASKLVIIGKTAEGDTISKPYNSFYDENGEKHPINLEYSEEASAEIIAVSLKEDPIGAIKRVTQPNTSAEDEFQVTGEFPANISEILSKLQPVNHK